MYIREILIPGLPSQPACMVVYINAEIWSGGLNTSHARLYQN